METTRVPAPVWVLTAGMVFFIFTLASWFGTAIAKTADEQRQLIRAMSWGVLVHLFWVMFFAVFWRVALREAVQ